MLTASELGTTRRASEADINLSRTSSLPGEHTLSWQFTGHFYWFHRPWPDPLLGWLPALAPTPRVSRVDTGVHVLGTWNSEGHRPGGAEQRQVASHGVGDPKGN
jgi:hypothetical protein